MMGVGMGVGGEIFLLGYPPTAREALFPAGVEGSGSWRHLFPPETLNYFYKGFLKDAWRGVVFLAGSN